MKKLIIIFISCFTLNNLKAESDSLTCLKDSSYCNEMVDSISLQQEALTIENKPFEMMKKAELKKINLQNNLTKPANWFGDIWDAFTDLFKPVWGYYEEEGQHQEGPYFLFDRTLDGHTYTQIQMDRMRTFILQDVQKTNSIYFNIFNLAGTTTIDNCTSGEGICESQPVPKQVPLYIW